MTRQLHSPPYPWSMRAGPAPAGRAPRRVRRGFTIVEAAIALVVVIVLIGVLLPALQHARTSARRDQCGLNQTSIGVGWLQWLREHEAFPDVQGDPAWMFAGVSFSRVNGQPSLDFSRPLNQYLSDQWSRADGSTIFLSPLDRGIAGEGGTGGTTVFQSHGISYRANTILLDAREAGLDSERRPLRIAEVKIDPAWVIVMGPPFWHETVNATGRVASWYGKPDEGSVLFMDGSVRPVKIVPGTMSNEHYALVPDDDRED